MIYYCFFFPSILSEEQGAGARSSIPFHQMSRALLHRAFCLMSLLSLQFYWVITIWTSSNYVKL